MIISLPKLALPAALLLAACSGSSGGGGGPAGSFSVDANGGALVVSSGVLQGLRLDIPSGSLSSSVVITVDAGTAIAQAGWLDVGPVAAFTPADTMFDSPVSLTLPFDKSIVPAGTLDADFAVKVLDSQSGAISDLVPATVDREGTVSVAVDRLATFWVAVPVVDPNASDIAIDRYLPLNVGDTYEFDKNLTVAVAELANPPHPNLGLSNVLALVLTEAGVDQGIYLDREPDGSLVSLGEFSDSFQFVYSNPLLRAPSRPVLDAVFEAKTTWTGYVPFGTQTPLIAGNMALKATVVRVDPEEAVRLTGFADVVQLVTETTMTVPGVTGQLQELTFLWLARGVGLVGITDERGREFSLQRALVGGVVVTPGQ